MRSKRTSKSRVVGIGGIFIRARHSKEMSAWYAKHLGITTKDNVAIFSWRGRKSNRPGHTVWALFPRDTKYFHSKRQQVMINYRVKNLDKFLKELRQRSQVRVDKNVERTPYGKFGWITDPEGNRIELWEPPRAYRATGEPEIHSE